MNEKMKCGSSKRFAFASPGIFGSVFEPSVKVLQRVSLDTEKKRPYSTIVGWNKETSTLDQNTSRSNNNSDTEKRNIPLSPSKESSQSVADRQSTSEDCQFDVFLNFCGTDTRKGFTDFLYHSLTKANINTFKDDEGLSKGQKIEDLLQVIEQSKISIPIFSRNYASREWCLHELAKIVECYNSQNQKILPIFYDVKPSIVREQSESYKKAFIEHKKKFSEQTIQEWKKALKVVASLNGWELRENFNGYEKKLIDVVVSTLLKELKRDSCDVFVVKTPEKILLEPVIGSKIEEQTTKLLSCIKWDKFQIFGIYGLGGVGKTTLAKNIRDTLCSRNFKEVYWVFVSQQCNIYNLQNKIAEAFCISLLSKDEETVRAAKLLEALQRKGNFILFLDDVWSSVSFSKIGITNQIKGCKVILTSRSSKVCKMLGCRELFKVEPLGKREAWNLFEEKLGHDADLTLEIKDAALKITEKCDGLPLAIITLGCSMRGEYDIEVWRDTLRILQEGKKGNEDLDSEVFPILQLSYDHLNNVQLQHCFLLCATYPVGHAILKDNLIELFRDVGLIKELTRGAEFDRGYTIIQKLLNASLLERVAGDYLVTMHDLIRDMALRIAESNFMMKANLSLKEIPEEDEWTNNSYEFVSLAHNKIESISKSIEFPKLSVLLLNGNYSLREISGDFFAQLVMLEVLDLSQTEIEELPNTVGNLVKLHALILHGCKNLLLMPSLANTSELRKLDLCGAPIQQVPHGLEKLVKLRYLDFRDTGIERLSTGILSNFYHLRYLSVRNLKAIELQGLNKIEELFTDFDDWIDYYTFVMSFWPKSINYRINVSTRPLWLSLCRDFKEVRINGENLKIGDSSFVIPGTSTYLRVEKMHDLRSIWDWRVQDNFINLESCSIVECNGMECLVLHAPKEACMSANPLQSSLFFSHLKYLYLDACPRLKKVFDSRFLPNLQNLEQLTIVFCHQVEEIFGVGDSDDDEEERMVIKSTISLPKLEELTLWDLPNLKSISANPLICNSLEKICVWACENLERDFLSLKSINGQLSPPSFLQNIKIGNPENKKWWEIFEWDDPLRSELEEEVDDHVVEEFMELLQEICTKD